MPVRFPQLCWPLELLEQGPPEDPTILLTGVAEIDGAPHRVYAIRMGPVDLQPDFRPELDDSVYAEARVEVMFEELIFLDDFDRSSLVSVGSESYLVWMVPSLPGKH